MLVKSLRAQTIGLFRETFRVAPKAAASAPGCIDLMGGHTAYNGGPTLPIATGERTVVVAGPAAPGVLEAVAVVGGRQERIDLREGSPTGQLATVAGVVRELQALGGTVTGVRLAVASGSSAAFAVACAKAVASLNRLKLPARQLAGVASRAGHARGVARDGVMEHAIAALARADHALLVECASAATRTVPLRGGILLVETNAAPGQAQVDERRAECDAAMLRLRVDLPELMWLASWPAAWLARLKRALPLPLRSRAVHIVSETARTRFAAELLAKGRYKRFGELLSESHESCRKLFDATTREADLVVSTALRAGAVGARLASVGAGGTVVVLLGRREEGRGKGAAKVTEAIERAFSKTFGRALEIRAVRPAVGVRSEPLSAR